MSAGKQGNRGGQIHFGRARGGVATAGGCGRGMVAAKPDDTVDGQALALGIIGAG